MQVQAIYYAWPYLRAGFSWVSRYQKDGWDVSRLAEVVSNRFGIRFEEMRRRIKDVHTGDARKVFCYIGSKEMEMPQSAIGEYLGISASEAWLLSRQGKAIMEKRKMKRIC